MAAGKDHEQSEVKEVGSAHLALFKRKKKTHTHIAREPEGMWRLKAAGAASNIMDPSPESL